MASSTNATAANAEQVAAPNGAAATQQPLPSGVTPNAPTAAQQGSYTSASLYVGDLSSDISEGQLFEIFNAVGPVASIRVCRDAVTRRSLGYAYVNFHNFQDAERTLDTMNNANIKGRPCRIMWVQRDPSLRKSGVGNIFIKNLDKSIDHKALYDTFSRFGNILSCKVVTDDGNSSKGYGFVHYETQEMAEKAIAKVNNMYLNGKQVFVGPFIPRREREHHANRFTNVYVKNLPETVTEATIQDLFKEAGTITSAVIMSDENGKSKGFGFINFEDHEGAQKCIDEYHNKEVEGKQLHVCRAQKRAERDMELRQRFERDRESKYQQGVNLYVKNLDDGVDDAKLRDIFTPFGGITSAKVMRDERDATRGFGFVCFNTPEEATRAINELNGKMQGTKPLYVALAQRKDQRRAQLEAQYAQRLAKGRMPPGAGGMGMPPAGPLYAAAAAAAGQGPPMFYANPGAMPQGFVFPNMAAPIPRSRWSPQGYGPGQQGGPNGQYPMQALMRQRGGGRGGMGRGGFRAQRGQRQQQQQQQQQMPMDPNQQQQQQMGVNYNQPQGGETLNAQFLSQFSLEQQSLFLGERLFPLIHKVEPDLAGKITGMLLDKFTSNPHAGQAELINLIHSPEALQAKIAEALDVLRQHSGNNAAGEEQKEAGNEEEK